MMKLTTRILATLVLATSCLYSSAQDSLQVEVLRLGYRNLIETSWVHNLNTQIFTHGFVIGISGEWLQLGARQKKLSPAVRIVSALY